MFFGTSAKTYFLSAVAPGCTEIASSVANAAPAARYFFIALLLPSLSCAPTPAELFQQHRENDENADESALPVRIHPRHEEGITDHLDQCGADECAVRAALATHQVGAADHRRGDHAQLVSGTERVDRR